jgi:ATP-binding cassette subfamily F protein 3
MIQLSGAGKQFGPKVLFENVDWLITSKERAGIVGGNGTGKSTLLKVLAGLETLDRGDMAITRGTTAGYLPQDGLSLSGRTVFAECMTVFDDVRALEQEHEDISRRLADMDHSGIEYQQASERLHRVDSEFHARGGYTVESQVGSVLSGLGFGREEWVRRTEEFSGGWQMRIALAKLLLAQPNLLLLDEPTNHLDIEARNWLEEYLSNYPHAFVLISHDRFFLDQTVTRIAELWNKRMWFYTGGYSKFETQKQDRRIQIEAAYKNQQEKVEQLEAFINRFRAQATKAKQVQSRIKELERIERIEIPPDEKTIHFRFPQPKPSGRIVAEFRDVAKTYGETHVFSHASFVIERGERVALAGVNGAGKSTLIKILAGVEPVTSGEYTLGHNAEPDYFAQDQYKELDVNARMLDDLGNVSPRSTNTELRTLLGSFLFSDDDVFKRIGVLSGGERNRYALARMLMVPSNFLLLDEPTNHLDMRAKDVLLTALQNFTGTVVFVSHDRYFLEQLATKVIEVGAGEVHSHPYGYLEYLQHKEGLAAAGVEAAPEVARVAAAAASVSEPDAQRRLNPLKLRKMQERRTEIEEDVAKLEAEIAVHENSLANYVSAEHMQEVHGVLTARRADLEALMNEWEEVSESIEANA